MGNLLSGPFESTPFTSSLVHIENGDIVGKQFDVGDDRRVAAFLGVPFAKPPVGPLRYKKPEPAESWEGVRECKTHGPRAPQSTMALEKLAKSIPVSEDCLYLNVFAEQPFTTQGSGKAVILFFHGGGFAMHTSANYGDIGICRHLCTKEVIVVTTQYRLGLLGFMATGDEQVTPNLGLWDQAMAIRWVSNNIAAFGGDPSNITVVGQSAGAASVDMLSLSPYTRDLFSKVVAMGGSASCEWATNTVDSIMDIAMDRASSHGWVHPRSGSEADVSRSLMSFLKRQPAKHLGLGIMSLIKKGSRQSGLYLVPVIDGDFLPEPISELRKKTPHKVCMVGTTEYEGLLFASFARSAFGRSEIKKLIPNRITPDKFTDCEALRRKAWSMYITEGASPSELDRGYVRLLSDVFINNGVHELADGMSKAGHTVYLYSFDYCNPTRMGLFKHLYIFPGATHGSELPYLFARGMVGKFRPDAVDQIVQHNFTTIFANFAKYGNPNGVDSEQMWKPLTTSDAFSYLSISDQLTMKSDYQGKRALFWRDLQNRSVT